MYPVKPLVDVLRRAVHSGYKTLLLHNRMLIQCYDLNIDTDNGFHYILHLPDDLEGDFYDMTLVITPATLAGVIRDGHRELDSIRKERKLKPKDAIEEFAVKGHKDGSVTLTFSFMLLDELITTKSINIPTIDDYNRTMVDNIQESLFKLMDRIRPGGFCMFYDGVAMGLINKIYDAGRVYDFIAKPNGRKLKVPFTRSSFLGMKNPEIFQFSIQESTLEHIYILSIRISNNGSIEENLWGYLLDY